MLISVSELLSVKFCNSPYDNPVVLSVMSSPTCLCLNLLSPVPLPPFSVCSTCLDPVLFSSVGPWCPIPVPPVKPCPNEHHIFSTTKEHMFCVTISLQFDALGSSSVEPRSKRYVHGHTTKVSFKDLTLELAKKHVSLLLILSSSQIEPTNKRNIKKIKATRCY